MSIGPIVPINLQQIAAGTDAATRVKASQGSQAENETATQQAAVAAAVQAAQAEAVPTTAEGHRLDQQKHSTDDGPGERRRRRRRPGDEIEPAAAEGEEPHDGEILDIVA